MGFIYWQIEIHKYICINKSNNNKQINGGSLALRTRFQECQLWPQVGPCDCDGGKWSWHCTCAGQDSSNELDLEWIRPVVEKFWLTQCWKCDYYVCGYAHVALMGELPWHCTSSGQNGSLNLIQNESTRWLPSSFPCKIPGALIMPMGMAMWSQWANDHGAAHLDANKFPMNLIGSKSPSGCWVVASSFQVCLLHTPMDMPWWAKWANDHDVAHVQISSNEHSLEWIMQVVTGLQHLQIGSAEWTDGQVNTTDFSLGNGWDKHNYWL